jgi:hypothetical protein
VYSLFPGSELELKGSSGDYLEDLERTQPFVVELLCWAICQVISGIKPNLVSHLILWCFDSSSIIVP